MDKVMALCYFNPMILTLSVFKLRERCVYGFRPQEKLRRSSVAVPPQVR